MNIRHQYSYECEYQFPAFVAAVWPKSPLFDNGSWLFPASPTLVKSLFLPRSRPQPTQLPHHSLSLPQPPFLITFDTTLAIGCRNQPVQGPHSAWHHIHTSLHVEAVGIMPLKGRMLALGIMLEHKIGIEAHDILSGSLPNTVLSDSQSFAVLPPRTVPWKTSLSRCMTGHGHDLFQAPPQLHRPHAGASCILAPWQRGGLRCPRFDLALIPIGGQCVWPRNFMSPICDIRMRCVLARALRSLLSGWHGTKIVALLNCIVTINSIAAASSDRDVSRAPFLAMCAPAENGFQI
ncbi:hypothetical protein GGX14DRAFT_569940 [Mycena pura]|uniref:Uncharacterized protein n=1 Tax=Mycena pura TaxID=153505 RepID=A0AAD6Y6F7_9AGAR|nr:hypothetical protein GGX14DRAFT_569940 [Mycena pura]